MARTVFLVTALALGTSLAASAAPPAIDPNIAWESENNFTLHALPSGPGPVVGLAGYPHDRSSYIEGHDYNNWVGDANNPILTPWAAGIVKKKAAETIKSKEDPFWAQSICWPGGMAILLWSDPSFFLQTPKEVMIVYQRDQQVRHVYLDTAHSAHPKPSWYGESVGHYEGDTLVIDTIGFNRKTFVDRYGTPHSEQLHVIERYHVSPDGKTLLGQLTVDDPEAFTQQWQATVQYNRTRGTLTESVCAENTVDAFNGKPIPLPLAAKSDF